MSEHMFVYATEDLLKTMDKLNKRIDALETAMQNFSLQLSEKADLKILEGYENTFRDIKGNIMLAERIAKEDLEEHRRFYKHERAFY